MLSHWHPPLPRLVKVESIKPCYYEDGKESSWKVSSENLRWVPSTGMTPAEVQVPSTEKVKLRACLTGESWFVQKL